MRNANSIKSNFFSPYLSAILFRMSASGLPFLSAQCWAYNNAGISSCGPETIPPSNNSSIYFGETPLDRASRLCAYEQYRHWFTEVTASINRSRNGGDIQSPLINSRISFLWEKIPLVSRMNSPKFSYFRFLNFSTDRIFRCPSMVKRPAMRRSGFLAGRAGRLAV
jgi:hypothetical protein